MVLIRWKQKEIIFQHKWITFKYRYKLLWYFSWKTYTIYSQDTLSGWHFFDRNFVAI